MRAGTVAKRGWCLALVAGLVLACGGDDARAEREAGQAALEAGDASRALAVARRLLGAGQPDPRAALLAADACLALDRLGDCLDHVQAGLQAAEEPGLRAELQAVRGAASMERFRDLAQAEAWRAANTALQRGTEAGGRRAEAAWRLVWLQDLGPLGDRSRQQRFARLFLQLEPATERAARVRALLGEAPTER